MDSSIHSGETNADRKRQSRNAAKEARMLAQTRLSEREKKAGLIGFGLAVIGALVVVYFLVDSHQIELFPFALTPSRSDRQEFRDYYGFAFALLALPIGIVGQRFVWGKAALVLAASVGCLDLLVHASNAFYQLSLG